MIILFSVGHPVLFWLFTGTWEWLPVQKWLHAGLICIPGAMSAALLFIFGNWLDYGGATVAKKIGVGLLVFGASFGIIFIGRKIVSYIVLISFGIST
ncbi:hypothetical protein [Parvibium lacunae]|nr:hypothetical protein [Parvibium lacunae]